MHTRAYGKRKIMAVVTAAAVAAAMTASPVFAAETAGFAKDETVYVITAEDGSVKETIVSDHLENKTGSKVIHDATDLKNIENVKGDERFSYDEKTGKLIWQAAGKDIYYQGSSQKDAPVSLDVKYYLNGKSVSGEDIQGKSGKLRIDLSYTNHTNVPFAVMTGLMVEDDCLRHVSVSSGKVIDDGEKQVIAAMALPGTAQKLGIKAQREVLTDHVVIWGEAKNFSCEDMMTVVTADLFGDIDLGDLDPTNLDSQVKELSSGSKKLVSGSKTLYQGVHLLDEKSQQLADGVGALNQGAKKLESGSKDALQGSKKLAEGTSQLSQQLDMNLKKLSAGAQQVATGTTALKGGLQQIQAALNGSGETTGLAAGAQAVVDGLAGLGAVGDALQGSIQANQSALKQLETLKGDESLSEDQRKSIEAIEQSIQGSIQYQSGASEALKQGGALKDGAGAVASGIGTLQVAFNGSDGKDGLVESAGKLESGAVQVSQGLAQATGDTNSLTAGAKEVESGAKALNQGQEQLSVGARELAKGMGTLNDNTAPLVSGVNQLDLGAKALSDGMVKLYKEGISKLVELYDGKLKDLINGFDTMTNAGENYNIFTKLPEHAAGTVKFVYKTEIVNQ